MDYRRDLGYERHLSKSKNLTSIQFVAVKIYYRPKELVEELGISEKELSKFAYASDSLYEVEGVRLVNLPVLMESLNKYRSLLDDTNGTYMELDDAVKKTGLSSEVIVRLSSEANAIYQVGKIGIIDMGKLDDYIRSFPVASDMEELKPQKIYGSMFVREIYRNQQKI